MVFTQVCVSFGSDERTREVIARLLAEGEAWMSGSVWRGRAVLRISVSNWSTTEGDVRRSLRALRARRQRAESGGRARVRRLICRVVGELLSQQRA